MTDPQDGTAPSPVPLMQISTGFWASKTLATAHELGLFDHLDEMGGVTPAELAEAYAIDLRPADMLLTGCAALGLLEKRGERYLNAPLADRYLVRGRPYYFGGWIEMLDRRLYPGWGKLTEAVRTNRPTTWDPDRQRSLFEGEDPELLEVFWEAMHSLSSMTARTFGETVDLGDRAHLLDLGGGSGAWAIELCRLYPALEATVFDLPGVVEVAQEKIATAGLGDRIDTVAGDFFAEGPLPTGYDAILLSMVLHDWAETKNRALLGKCHEALPAGGRVVIAELLVDDDRTGPAPAALMSLNMLIETEGRNYTAAEYQEWLLDAGFRDTATVRFEGAGANGAVIGYR